MDRPAQAKRHCAGDVVTNLQNGNFIGAALGGFRTANNFKNTNLKTVAGAELVQLGKNILSGQNPQSSVFFPTGASINQGLAKAVSGIPGLGGINNGTNINSQNARLESLAERGLRRSRARAVIINYWQCPHGYL